MRHDRLRNRHEDRAAGASGRTPALALSRRHQPRGRVAQGFGLVTGIAALAAGAVASGFELERRLVSSALRKGPRELPLEGFFTQYAPGPEVITPDGVRLHVEVEPGRDEVGPTVVFVHGYVLSLHCWHFQRRRLRGRRKMVLYDQRSHGRSQRSAGDRCRIPQLAQDLKQVLDATTEPDEKVVLVGHSMGGMTIQQFAADYPQLIGTKVVGAALFATSSGHMDKHSIIPGIPGEMFPPLAETALAAMNRIPTVVERSRRASTDVSYVVTRRMSYGSDVPPSYVDFMSEMVSVTPMDVVSDYYPAFAEYDGTPGLPALDRIETAVVGGESDNIIDIAHVRRLCELLPHAEHVILPRSGHMGIIEHHDRYSTVLANLLDRVGS